MKLAVVNTRESAGGAVTSSLRLHNALRKRGQDSRFLTRLEHRGGDNERSVSAPRKWLGELSYYLNFLPVGRANFRQGNPVFSLSWVPSRAVSRINSVEPDVVNLHWTSNYVNPEHIPRIEAPIVWTLHDTWAFTGGCHYPGDCNRYEGSCGNCPVLEHNFEHDLSRFLWYRKKHAWSGCELTFIAPSEWIANKAKESSLLSQHTINTVPNGVDLEYFKPMNQQKARTEFGLNLDSDIVLLGGVGGAYRKGVDLFIESLSKIDRDNLEVVTFGDIDSEFESSIPVSTLGYVPSDKLPLAYNIADVAVVPSRRENLSNMVIESIACGTPVVAFDIGGMPDMISNRENGYLATPNSTSDLANGIEWVLDADRVRLSENARKTAEQDYSLDQMANRYLSIFESVL